MVNGFRPCSAGAYRPVSACKITGPSKNTRKHSKPVRQAGLGRAKPSKTGGITSGWTGLKTRGGTRVSACLELWRRRSAALDGIEDAAPTPSLVASALRRRSSPLPTPTCKPSSSPTSRLSKSPGAFLHRAADGFFDPAAAGAPDAAAAHVLRRLRRLL